MRGMAGSFQILFSCSGAEWGWGKALGHPALCSFLTVAFEFQKQNDVRPSTTKYKCKSFWLLQKKYYYTNIVIK